MTKHLSGTVLRTVSALKRSSLRPLSWVYGVLVRWHNPGVSSRKAPIAVVSVGNLEVGGTGKSPLVQAICDGLIARGATPAILSRGYGGSLRGPLAVDPADHSAVQVGDEPLMHAIAGYRVFVGGDRWQSARLAATSGADIAVLDDGHATKSVRRDFSILVFRPGFSNRPDLLPLGRLREPLARGLARCQLAVVSGRPSDADLALLSQAKVPLLRGEFRCDPPLPETSSSLSPSPSKSDTGYLLVTGVANPLRVSESAAKAGWSIADHLAFADHHRFSDADVRLIEHRLSDENLALLTTAKDIVRMPVHLAQSAVLLTGGWHPENPAAFNALMDQLLTLRHQ